LNLFFREDHGAEKKLFRRSGIFRLWLLGVRLLRLPFRLGLGELRLGRRHVRSRALIARAAILVVATGFIPARVVPAGFIAAGFIAAGLVPAGIITTRLIPARIALRWLHLARRLDAAERSAKFINLAFISQLLTLGEFHEFKDLVQLVDCVLELLGDFGRVQNGLMDGRRRSGTKIGGLHPLAGTLRFRPAFRRTAARHFPWKVAGHFAFRCGGGHFLGGLGGGRFPGFALLGGKVGGHFGVRLAITAGVLHLGGFGRLGRLAGVFVAGLAGFRRIGDVIRRHRRFFTRWPRAAAAAAAATTTTAAVDGTSRGSGRLQIGIFVRHRYSGEDDRPAGKSKAN
jgi:hypothetical protein